MLSPLHNDPAGVLVDSHEFREEPADQPAPGVRELRRSPRVLHLVDTLNVGGTENQLVQVALRTHAAGGDVVVGCLRAEGPLLQVLRQASIPVVEFRKEKTLLSFNGVRQLLRLARYLRSGKFDVMHAHDLWASLLGVPAARFARTPLIISSRRYLADLEWYTPSRNRVIRLIYRLSTRVVVNSRAVQERLVDRDRLPARKVVVLYNAVDVGRFARARKNREKVVPNLPEGSKVIAVLANMYSRVKGHAALISAAQIVCRSEPQTFFLLIGDGRERPALQVQAHAVGLGKNVLFVGPRSDVPELLACCDLSVLPSEAEAFPNALLESMSAALPVVATAVGGNKEIIQDGANGLLVPPGNPEALAFAILRVIGDPRLARNLARAGQADVKTHFSFERLFAELDQLYKEHLHS